jgi:hypothetical protein
MGVTRLATGRRSRITIHVLRLRRNVQNLLVAEEEELFPVIWSGIAED